MNKSKEINFLVIGCQKCGTSTLHHWLTKEQQVCLPKQKETHFFSHDEKYAKGIDWYFSQFEEKDNCLYGEVDPEYIFWPKAAERINKLSNRPKIVIILRDPVERMISQYQMSVRRAIEPLTLRQAINNGQVRKNENPINFYKHYSYIERSLYRKQIDLFKKNYGGKEYLLVSFDELFSENIYSQYKRICDFLGFKTALKESDLKEKINTKASPRFPAINKILWDKNKYKCARKIFSFILSPKIKRAILNSIYSKNKRKNLQEEQIITKSDIPKDITLQFEKESNFIKMIGKNENISK